MTLCNFPSSPGQCCEDVGPGKWCSEKSCSNHCECNRWCQSYLLLSRLTQWHTDHWSSLSLTSPSSTLPHSSISSLSHPGGLVCRGFLEAFPDHNVKTFISLSSPQAGQFGGEIAFIAQPTAVHKGFTPNRHRVSQVLVPKFHKGQSLPVSW